MGSLTYRMLECPDRVVVAQVDNKGLLSSGSLAGTSSLLVTSQETFGVNQTLVLAVKVSGPSGRMKAASTGTGAAALSLLPAVIMETPCWMYLNGRVGV